jgi:beta-lactamase regulating signal transducer with metallopeptidase domain
LALLLPRPLTRRFFSRAWHYYAGLVPALFLLGAGAAASAALGALDLPAPAAAPFAAEGFAGLADDGAPPSDIARSVFIGGFTGGAAERAGEIAEIARASLAVSMPLVSAVWLAGALVFLTRRLAGYARFRRGVARNGKPLTGTNCGLPVLVCPDADTPMLLGVIRPVVVLPARDYREHERALILAHESAHRRRGDMWIKLLLLTANALHWFNPLAYAMNRDAERLCESACDEALARGMDKARRVLYGEVILSAAARGHAPALCAGVAAAKDLKRRLSYMLNAKRMKKPAAALSLLAICAAAAGGVWLAGRVDRGWASSPAAGPGI